MTSGVPFTSSLPRPRRGRNHCGSTPAADRGRGHFATADAFVPVDEKPRGV